MSDHVPDALPLWCRTIDPAHSVEELRCSVRPPRGWDGAADTTPLPGLVQCLWRGPDVRDALVVSFMPAAVPGHRMLTWVEAPMAICGFPEPALQPLLVLAHWEPDATPVALAARLGTDELHVLRGLARADGTIARLYCLLARRGQHAWKLFLSIASAAGSGDELAHLRDDDARAGAVFGALVLVGPP